MYKNSGFWRLIQNQVQSAAITGTPCYNFNSSLEAFRRPHQVSQNAHFSMTVSPSFAKTHILVTPLSGVARNNINVESDVTDARTHAHQNIINIKFLFFYLQHLNFLTFCFSVPPLIIIVPFSKFSKWHLCTVAT